MKITLENLIALAGLIGTGFGIVSTWLLIRDRRQYITIDIDDSRTATSQSITNRSGRPIPIQAVELRWREKIGFMKWREVGVPVEVEGLPLPGVLEPETRKKIDWSIHDIISLVVYKHGVIVVTTQTGKQIRRKIRHPNQRLHGTRNPERQTGT